MLELLQQTPLLVFSNLLLIFILYRYTRPAFVSGYLSSMRIKVTIALCFVFCLFSFWGADWFGYLAYFKWAKNGSIEHVPMESFYLWLVDKVCTDYLQFRMIVWGLALILFIFTLRRLRLNLGLALFFFCSIYLIYFSYARASLAMSLLFAGYSLLWEHNRKAGLKNRLIGLLLIGLSFFCHKSSALGIAAVVGAIIVKKWGRNGVILVLLAFPLLVFAMQFFLQDMFGSIVSDEDSTLGQYAQVGADYMDKKSGFSGLGTFIQKNVLEQCTYYILALCCYKEIKSPSVEYGVPIKSMMVLLFVLVITALIFAFDLGVNTKTIFGRYLRYAQIPACIVLTYMYSNGIQPRLIRWAYTMGIIGCFYSLIYIIYNVIVG